MNSGEHPKKHHSRALARNSKELKRAEADKKVLSVKVKKAPMPMPVPAPVRDYAGADEVIARAKLEREKRLIMWSGVAFLMTAIVIFWVFNTRSIIFGASERAAADSGEFKELWAESRDGLAESIRQLQEGMATLEEAAQAAERQAAEALDDVDGAAVSDGFEVEGEKEAPLE